MESARTLESKLKILEKALSGFSKLLRLPMEGLNEVQADGIKNGQIQKFEYCIELLWKSTQFFLNDTLGVAAKGPKPVFRELLAMNLISSEDCHKLLKMVDARNETSHIYEENILAEILPMMNDFLPIMVSVCDVMKNYK